MYHNFKKILQTHCKFRITCTLPYNLNWFEVKFTLPSTFCINLCALDINRYNICIMAYGQTGSGKTHTMLGSHKNEDYNPSRDPHRDEGVIPRAARELFRSVWGSGKTGQNLNICNK